MSAVPPDLERDLHAYVDGMLDDDPVRREAVEARIAECAPAAAMARAYLAQNAALRAAYGARILEPVPRYLSDILDGPARPVRRRAAAAAAMFAVAAVAGFTGWTVGHLAAPDRWSADSFIRTTYDYYARAGGRPEKLARTVVDKPLNWRSGRLSLSFRAPDLTSLGYALVATDSVEVGGVRAVRLRYAKADGSGGAFSLFLRPRWGGQKTEGVQVIRQGDVSLAGWLDGPLAATVAGRLPRKQVDRVAIAIRRAMRRHDVAPAALRPAAPKRHEASLATDNAADGTPVSDTSLSTLGGADAGSANIISSN